MSLDETPGTTPGAATEAVLARTVEAAEASNGEAPPAPGAGPSPHPVTRSPLLPLLVTALGIVYGDIGTSPLYALREAFLGPHAIAATRGAILGVLSLVVWLLLLVVGVKYVAFVMRADNRGEGGVLALVALLSPRLSEQAGQRRLGVLVAFGLFAAALLYGDGIITPAISVLSAVEGLGIAAPGLARLAVPLALVVLLVLFRAQRYGTERVGRFFGPVMALWFAVIAVLGVMEIVRHPDILVAVDPRWALDFLAGHPVSAFHALGAVVLVVTGAEALYADMGHCGRRPIQAAWFGLVFPALALNYLGQGALMLHGGGRVTNPFYELAPRALLYPLVALATAATVVASQALITGAFSLTRQLMHLGYSPLMTVRHTSKTQSGQVYVPEVNSALMIGCIALVLAFRSSSGLAAAYGVAVTGTMLVTTLLFYAVTRHCWGWSKLRAGALAGAFLAVDVVLLASNLPKIQRGGWLPLALAALLFGVFTSWRAGRQLLLARRLERAIDVDTLLEGLEADPVHRVPGTAVFISLHQDAVPGALLHHLEHTRVLHEQVLLLSFAAVHAQHVPPAKQVEVTPLSQGFFRVVARYGYLDSVDMPRIVQQCARYGISCDMRRTTFYLARERLRLTGAWPLAPWRKRLFVFLDRNAPPLTDFFRIPANRVIEVGTQVEI